VAGDVGRRPGDGAGIEVHKVSTQGSAATFYLDHAGSVNYPASASYGVCGSAGSSEDGYGVYGTASGTNGHAVEGFDVSGKSSVKPGTVLVIDPRHPSKLTVSACRAV
jgi:hypothetical protein